MSHSFHDGSLEDDDPYLTAITREPSSDRLSIRSTSACSFCYGNRIEVRHTARKAGGVIGMLAGACGAFAAVLPGAEAGATAGMIAGPVGAACGGIAGAILAAIAGGTAGCMAGSALGEMVDGKVLDRYVCLDCGATFNPDR